MHDDQVLFAPEIQGWVKKGGGINVNSPFNRLKNKNHMIISTNEMEIFNKLHSSLKNLSKLGKENTINPIEVIQ